MAKQAVACHREARARGGVGGGHRVGPLSREPPPAGAPPSVAGKKRRCQMTQKKRRRGEASGSVPQRGTRLGRGRRRASGQLPWGNRLPRGGAVCDDGGRLGESRGGRFRALLPEAEGASACVCARATSQRGGGGGRRARTLKGPAVRRGLAIRDGHLCTCVRVCIRCVSWLCHLKKNGQSDTRPCNPQTGRV